MANITTNAARMAAFNKGAPYITLARESYELYTEYIKANSNKLGRAVALHCAMAYVYWAGMTDGIRKERKRKKAH